MNAEMIDRLARAWVQAGNDSQREYQPEDEPLTWDEWEQEDRDYVIEDVRRWVASPEAASLLADFLLWVDSQEGAPTPDRREAAEWSARRFLDAPSPALPAKSKEME